MTLACSLALVLALDFSGSTVSGGSRGYDIQREGHIAALNSEAIARVVENRSEPVAILIIGFDENPRVVVPWTLVSNGRDLRALSATFERATRVSPVFGYTGTSTAIDYAVRSFQDTPCESEDNVIDVSTDGTPNAGRMLYQARDDAFSQGIRINFITFNSNNSVYEDSKYLNEVEFLRNNGVTPGGFLIDTYSQGDYIQGLRRKLVREITGLN